jgi:hypothetical protein
MAIIARLNAEVDRKRVATISQTGNDGHRVQVRKCRPHMKAFTRRSGNPFRMLRSKR